MLHNISFQRQYDWSCILVKMITDCPDISLLVPVTAASVLGALGNFIKKNTSVNYKIKTFIFVIGF